MPIRLRRWRGCWKPWEEGPRPVGACAASVPDHVHATDIVARGSCAGRLKTSGRPEPCGLRPSCGSGGPSTGSRPPPGRVVYQPSPQRGCMRDPGVYQGAACHQSRRRAFGSMGAISAPHGSLCRDRRIQKSSMKGSSSREICQTPLSHAPPRGRHDISPVPSRFLEPRAVPRPRETPFRERGFPTSRNVPGRTQPGTHGSQHASRLRQGGRWAWPLLETFWPRPTHLMPQVTTREEPPSTRSPDPATRAVGRCLTFFGWISRTIARRPRRQGTASSA